MLSGFYYVGPIDGHDLDQLLPILRNARDTEHGPILIHVATKKGKGYAPAEAAADKLHGSPVVTTSGVVLAGAQDERLYAVDPAGVLVWTLPAGGDLDSAPIVGTDGTLYLAGDDGRVRALR